MTIRSSCTKEHYFWLQTTGRTAGVFFESAFLHQHVSWSQPEVMPRTDLQLCLLCCSRLDVIKWQKKTKHVSGFSFDKVSQILWRYQTSHFISHLSTLLFIRTAWHSQGCRQRIRWRCGSLTEHLLITALAEKLLVQCDSEPVKAAATVKQPVLNATKQSVKLMGTHLSHV